MALQYFLLERDFNFGTAAETGNRDLPRTGVTKSLIFDVTAQNNGTSAGSRLLLTSMMDQFRLGVVESNRVSEIDGGDLDAFNVLRGSYMITDNGTEDNERIVYGFSYPLDPFTLGKGFDLSQPFGVSGSVARKIEFVYEGDATTDAGLQVDDTRLAIGVINNTTQGTGGYTAFHRDAYTATDGSNNFTDVPQPGKLLGVLNFETTEPAAETADADHRVNQGIQEQAITIGRKDVLGGIYTTMGSYLNGSGEIGAISDEGFTFWDLGFNNSSGNLGVPTGGSIPDDMEIRSLAGVAEATRVHAVTLNTNT